MEEDLCFSQIFNVIYDKSGKLIVSADEEGLIKLWSADTGLLLWSLKGNCCFNLGHSTYMEELLITASNKYLVSCGNDGLRIWCLSTRICLAVIYCEACVYSITSFTNEKGDEVVCFADANNIYQISEPEFKGLQGRCLTLEDIMVSHPIPKSVSGNNLICEIDIGPRGHLILGTESGEVIVFDRTLLLPVKPATVAFCQSREHTKKCVEIKWNKEGTMLASCSLDGSCRIWELTPNCFAEGSFRSIEQLRMPKNEKRRHKRKDIICSTASWTCNGKYLLAAFAECNREGEENLGEGDIVVFDVAQMTIVHEVRSKLPYQLDSVNVLEPHPYHENVALFCEASGRIVLLDVVQCSIMAVFSSKGFHLGHPNFNVEPVEGKWNPDGNTFVLSTEYGNISIYGYGPKEPYRICPTDQFYASDSEVFIYDNNRTPLTLDGQIDINSLDRGEICNVSKVPYGFRYSNDIESLTQDGYFNSQIANVRAMTNRQCYKPTQQWVNCLQEQNL